MSPFPDSPMSIGDALFIFGCLVGSAMFWYGTALIVRVCFEY